MGTHFAPALSFIQSMHLGPSSAMARKSFRVAGHLLAAHDKFNDAVDIVRVTWVCPLGCFGLLMAAEVGERTNASNCRRFRDCARA